MNLFKKRAIGVGLLVCFVFVLPYAWSRFAAPSRRIAVRSMESAAVERADDAVALRVACYNIAHGRGLAADNWTAESAETRLARLDQIATLLQSIDADVVVLNEVDFDSSWSHGVNQSQYLARQAGYTFWCEGRNLDFRVLTYTWRFGNAILSRYPIADVEEIVLPGFQQWEEWLAGKKRGLGCTIELGHHSVRMVAVHLSHRSETVRCASARALCDWAESQQVPTLLAGDFNSTPPDLAMSVRSSAGENAMQLLDEAPPFQRYRATHLSNSDLTFRSEAPTRVIDWILIPPHYRFTSYRVVESTLSDHRPVIATVE